ncbi:DUF6285 domain-containing protein [Sandarakinorhabdus sp.]|uniref:DUF6285 domain-containing protein n=1 Tax=Sandarakinorhabdus sp. TaxID=1916663 RepID=UPI003F7269CB
MAEQIEAQTLIEAVAGFLAELEPALKGRQAFHAKVAQNALAIVARELAQAPQQREQMLLAGVMGSGDDLAALRAGLCADLRSGAKSVDTPGLVDALLGVALAKCAVDNPRYSTLKRLQG